jgi:hypothetical protein
MPTKVFISYSHDSEPHSQRVLALANQLRKHGVDAELDQYVTRPPQGWPRWCEEQLQPERSEFVLVVCTETYLNRIEGKVPADEGRGVFWEGSRIYDYLYDQRSNSRFIPVVFDRGDETHIPGPLKNGTHYTLTAFDLSDSGYNALYRELTHQPAVEKPPLGEIVNLRRGSFGIEDDLRVLPPVEPREVRSTFEPIEPKWTDELRIYGEGFVGRQEELAALDRAWEKGVRIFALHAEGGAGKTRVIVEWLRQMRDDRWRGAQRVFVHSFYSQGSDERHNASSDLFFEQALAYFGYRGAPITQADEKGRELARLLVEHHGLLVLDGLEPLQHPPLHAERGRLKDPGIARLLLSLASVPHDETPSLCLITSRQPVIELQERTGATVVQQSLDHLHRNDGAALLKEFQVVGPDEELRQAADAFHGHAYSLMLLGSFLKNATDHHDIRRRREVVLLEEDTEHRSHARNMFAAYVRHLGEHSPEVAVLRLLGFFDRAAERQLLDVLRAREAVVYEWSEDDEPAERQPQAERIEDSLSEVTAPLLDLPPPQWHRALNRLRELRLIDFTGSGTSPAVDAHPLLHECFAEQVRTQFPAAWQAGHRRLFEHLAGTAPYWPEGIEGLQPLYQAVAHACLAGLHQQACDDVYRDRILRGTEVYSIHKLGAIGADLGAVACFFTTPWTTLAPNLAPAAQAWLLSEAAFRLRALGRLTEAIEPMRAGLKMRVEQEVWRSAAIIASNLSELQLTRGEVSEAVTVGEQSVFYADRSENAFQQIGKRTTLANALHHAGRRDESRRLFEEAESRQATFQPKYPRLYSLAGFRYCDLLLSDAERAAWQLCLLVPLTASTAACDAVSERAAYTLKIAERDRWLLDIASPWPEPRCTRPTPDRLYRRPHSTTPPPPSTASARRAM